jgi:hypothetical protein
MSLEVSKSGDDGGARGGSPLRFEAAWLQVERNPYQRIVEETDCALHTVVTWFGLYDDLGPRQISSGRIELEASGDSVRRLAFHDAVWQTDSDEPSEKSPDVDGDYPLCEIAVPGDDEGDDDDSAR